MSLQRVSKISLINIMLFITIALLIYLLAFEQPEDDNDNNTRISSYSPEEIYQVEIATQKAGKIVLIRQDGNNENPVWKMTSPYEIKSNDFNVKRLLEILLSKPDRQFSVTPDELAKYGLQAPTWQMTFNDLTIKFGDTEPINRLRYVFVDDVIYLLQDRYSQFSYDAPYTFISTRLLDSGSGQLSAIFSDKFQLHKLEDGWKQVSRNSQQALHEDDIVQFIENWRSAEAIRVTTLRRSTLENITTRHNINLVFDKNDEIPVRLIFLEKNDANLVVNQDNLITYIVSKDTYQRLLEPFIQHAGTS